MTREEYLRREYAGRMNKAMDYAYANLGRDFELSDLADAACFSRYHFHRMFSAFTGETPGEFLRRIRLAKAAGLLRDDPRRDVTAVAMDAGFSSPSVFSRAFKERFGVSPSAFRDADEAGLAAILKAAGLARSKPSQTPGKRGQAGGNGRHAPGGLAPYDEPILDGRRRNDMTKLEYQVEVKDLPEMTVAYARHVGAYNLIGETFSRLYRWAGPRGLIRPETMHLACYHDDPDLTPPDKLRSSACISVAAGTPTDGDIGSMKVPGGLFAVGHFEIDQTQFGEAWNALMGEWLPSSGYQADDRMCYELYLNDHEKHPQRKFIVDICQPVKPM